MFSSIGRPLAAAVAASFVVGFGGPGAAQDLWNGTRLGMTVAEVQGAFPQAAHGARIDQGDDLVLRVPNLRAGGDDATAFFDFDGGRLATVELLVNPDSGARVDTAEIRHQLTAKYGSPWRCDEERASCDWRSGGVDISLVDTATPDGQRVEILYGASEERPPRDVGDDAQVALVRAFYNDLSTGDGAAASSLVVPEKRAEGPFSAPALDRFYGSLPGPVRLVAAHARGGGSVFVRYRFVAAGGHVCDGAADVRTRRAGDRLLIAGIRSYNGC